MQLIQVHLEPCSCCLPIQWYFVTDHVPLILNIYTHNHQHHSTKVALYNNFDKC